MSDEDEIFRFGKYGISQDSMNVVVGDIYTVTSGKNIGEDRIRPSSKTYHRNYESALDNIFDRMMRDKMHTKNLSFVKSLKESLIETKEEISRVLKENPSHNR